MSSVGTVVKFKERYSTIDMYGVITSEVPPEEMSLYYYYAKALDGNHYGLAGHEIKTEYGQMTLEEWKENHPELLI